MASPTRKPDAQRRNKPSDLRVIPGALAEAPAADKSWLKVTRDAWGAFWGSEVSTLVGEAGLQPLRRLFRLYDERERADRALLKSDRVVQGSTGQPVANPLYGILKGLDGEIGKLEDRFGFTPRAKLNLGLQVGAVRQSLDRLNREFDDEIAVVEIDDADGG